MSEFEFPASIDCYASNEPAAVGLAASSVNVVHGLFSALLLFVKTGGKFKFGRFFC
jgi:hypothetical protein